MRLVRPSWVDRSIVFIAAAAIMASLVAMGFGPPASAQSNEPPDQGRPDRFFVEPTDPPAGVEIERTLYSVPMARESFDCETPIDTAVVVSELHEADYACTAVTNTNTEQVEVFPTFDPDFSPHFTYVPDDFADRGGLVAGETYTIQQFVPATVAWQSSAPVDGDRADYERALERLIELGVADPAAADWPGWDFNTPSLDPQVSTPIVFEDQVTKWQVLGIDDYEFTWRTSGEILDSHVSYTIRVVDGVVVAATADHPGPVPLHREITLDDVIDELLLERGEAKRYTWATRGQVDVLFGYPVWWDTDSPPYIADEAGRSQASQFAPLVSCGSDDWRRVDVFDEVDVCGDTGGALGDVDCDGRATIIDALLVALYEAGAATDVGRCPDSPLTLDAAAGDVNGDGGTDVIDALLIAQCSVGRQNVFCTRMAPAA